MPTREEIMQMKAAMKNAGMKWANMDDTSWGPGQAALYKKYLSGLQRTNSSRTGTAASPITMAPVVGGSVVAPAVAAGAVVNPAARDELTGGPATLEYALHSFNDWGRENITPVLHQAVNTVASGVQSAWDWLTGLGRMFDDSSTSSEGATTSAKTSSSTTAQPASGGVPNPNDDKKKKLQEKAEKTKGWFQRRWRDLGPGQGYSWEGFHTGRNYWNIARDASIYAPAAWDLGTSIVLEDPSNVQLPVPIWGLAPGTNAYRPGNNTQKKETKKESEEYPDANTLYNQ